MQEGQSPKKEYLPEQFPFQADFLKSKKSLMEFLAEYDIMNSTSFFIKLNTNETLVQILKNISNHYINSIDLSKFTKISEKIVFLKVNYFPFIKKHYSMNNFPEVIQYLSHGHKIYYAEYILHLSNIFWEKSEVYDYDYNFHTRRLKLCKILQELHKDSL